MCEFLQLDHHGALLISQGRQRKLGWQRFLPLLPPFAQVRVRIERQIHEQRLAIPVTTIRRYCGKICRGVPGVIA